MICKLEHGNVIFKRQFLTQTITIRHRLIHPNLLYDVTYHRKKSGIHQEPHESVPPKFFFQQTDYVTELLRSSIRNMMQKWAWNSIRLFLLAPAVQKMLYVTIRSLIVTTTTDIECLTQHH